jgi:putative two-component system response regulator
LIAAVKPATFVRFVNSEQRYSVKGLEPEFPRQTANILIVDDEPANAEFLRHVLEPEGYGRVVELTSPIEALARFDDVDPDLVVLDLMMPECDGFEVMKRLRGRLEPDDYLPILIVTGDTSAETQRRALSLGARDFLTKPLSPANVRLRVRNLLETRFLQAQLREYNAVLEERVAERTAELEAARIEILDRLARAAEYRDDDTGQHTYRVGRIAAKLASVLGLPDGTVELIRRAAPLHDIGKIGIPDAILLKSGPLSKEERAVMQEHTRIGAKILSGSRFPMLQMAENIAAVHHERWDGRGYPAGLRSKEISLPGRIVAVADVFDSLTHERPYKPAWSVAQALKEIHDHAGAQFDPAVAAAMMRIGPQAARLSGQTRDTIPGEQVDLFPPEVRPDPVAARIRALEAERDQLRRQVRDLEGKVAARDARIEELSVTTRP